MKSPTLKATAQALSISVPRTGDFSATIGGCRVMVFTGSSWQRRSVRTIRTWPRKWKQEKNASKAKIARIPDECSLSEVAALTKRLAMELGYPVTGEYNRLLFTASPSGQFAQTNGRRNSRRPLP